MRNAPTNQTNVGSEEGEPYLLVTEADEQRKNKTSIYMSTPMTIQITELIQ